MSDFNLDTHHADYDATTDARVIGQDLYAGGAKVKAEGTTYLTQETNETDDNYAIRLARAVLDPWAEKIITARQALLFRKSHERELSGRAAQYVEDVDRQGTPADVFFQECARLAQAEGIHWVAVDMPQTPTEGFNSEAEETVAGHRPFFEHVPAASVLDWEVADDKGLLWAVVKDSEVPAREDPGYTAQSEARWKTWRRDGWQLWGPAQKNHGDEVKSRYRLIAEGPNTSGVVPLVPFIGLRYSDYAGYPVTRPMFDHILAIYRKWSDLDWFERVAAHPIPITLSPTKPEKLNTSGGFWIKTDAGGAPVSVFYLEPSGAAFGSARESIKELEGKIYQIALAQAKKDSAQVQSADGQREDRLTFSASLANASRSYEAAEARCWEIKSLWLKEPSAKHTVVYNRDFDDKTVEATILSALVAMTDAGILTKKTVLQTAIDGELVKVGDPDAEIKAAIQEAKERDVVEDSTMSVINSPDAQGSDE